MQIYKALFRQKNITRVGNLTFIAEGTDTAGSRNFRLCTRHEMEARVSLCKLSDQSQLPIDVNLRQEHAHDTWTENSSQMFHNVWEEKTTTGQSKHKHLDTKPIWQTFWAILQLNDSVKL